MHVYVQKLHLVDINMFLRLVAGLLYFVGSGSLTGVHVRQAGKTCRLPDITAHDGEVFVTSLTGPCVKYYCNDGNIFPYEYGCERDGKCFPLGDTYSVGCFRRTCAPSYGVFGYVLADEGCSFYSTCVPVNGTVHDGCQTYQCIKYGDTWSATYSLEVVEWGCSYKNGCVSVGHTVQEGCNNSQCIKAVNESITTLAMKFVGGGCGRNGQCMPVGDTFVSGCIERNCTAENGWTGYIITSEGCQYQNKCYKVGEIIQDGCTSYRCSKSVDSTGTTYSVDVHEEKCEDLNHQCLPLGSFFPYEISGVLRPNCTCAIFAGTTILYKCF